jgi:hypothetical protein
VDKKWEASVPKIYLAAIIGAMVTLAPAATRAADLVCENWSYSNDGGFEGGEDVAEVVCSPPGSDVLLGLTMMCGAQGGASLRAYSEVGDNEPTSEAIPVTYVVNGKSFVLSAHFEAADGAFVADAGPDLVGLLKAAEEVTLHVDGYGEPMNLPLAGAAAAIDELQAACRSD